MAQISLVVTRAVERSEVDQRQIAYRSPSTDIAPSLQAANRKTRVTIRLGGFLDLVVGDTGAIWRAHNSHQNQAFDKLFDLLRSRPDVEMRFLCDVVL